MSRVTQDLLAARAELVWAWPHWEYQRSKSPVVRGPASGRSGRKQPDSDEGGAYFSGVRILAKKATLDERFLLQKLPHYSTLNF